MKTLKDLAAPAVVARKLLESDLQEQCVRWAKARGYWARKFSSISQRSVPDYLFAGALRRKTWGYTCYHAVTAARSCSCCAWLPAFKFACEFKAPGKTSTPAQRDEQKAMRDAGWPVFECDDFEAFKKQVMEYERAFSV